jgi:ribosomal protein L11 methyltransferase
MVERSSETALARLLVNDRETLLRIEDALGEHHPDMASCSAPQTNGCWSLELHFGERPDEARIRALVETVAGPAVSESMRFERLAPTDWVRKSLAELRPVQAGRFMVHGSHDRHRIPVNLVAIEIEASLAFGTGHHASTQGCLLALDLLAKRTRSRRRAAARQRTRRQHVLDVGTGSGVLAIAAAKALHQTVLASDIEQVSVARARENAHSNGARRFVKVLHAAGVKKHAFRACSPYGLILANILLQPLRDMATPMARLAAPNAYVVISGLLLTQARVALASYRARGLVLARRITLGGWSTLVLQRKVSARSFAAHMPHP